MEDYTKVIGEAAVLEMLAEECSELSRKKRGENPTPKSIRNSRGEGRYGRG